MDLLLDINVVVDICTKREPFFRDADLALAKCIQEGGRLWLYAGSVQTLEYVTRLVLQRRYVASGRAITARQLQYRTRELLKAFSEDKHWLAALADEGPVFDSPDPEDEQLVRALGRFTTESIMLLTRDETLRQRWPDLIIAPDQYIAQPPQSKSMAFVDLAAGATRRARLLEINKLELQLGFSQNQKSTT